MSTANGPDDPAGQVRNLLFEKNDNSKIKITMIENLQNEKAEIEKKISHNEQLIADTQNQIYLLKKRQKLIDSFMKKAEKIEKEEQKPEITTTTLQQIAAGAALKSIGDKVIENALSKQETEKPLTK